MSRSAAGALAVALTLLAPAAASAHPTIMPGDVAIVAVSTNPANGPVGFRFVTLAAFHPVEVVIFTDRGWIASSGAFRPGEGEVYWDVDRLVPSGEVIERTGLELGAGSDSVVAFVGVLAPDGTPTDSLLFGVNLGGAWQPDAVSDGTSAMPPALAGFEVTPGPGLDCAYVGPTVGTRSELLASIGDAARWTCSDAERPPAPAGFTVYLDAGRRCATDDECAPSFFCAHGVCCDSECRRDEPGHCETCDYGIGDPRNGTCGPAPTTYLCRVGRGACDPMDTCDGVSTECPPNELLGASDVCRASTGGCDPAEVCDGASVDCPPDALAPAGTECRPSRGVCDPAERCAGEATCPPDEVTPDGTACDDELVCTAESSCADGLCAGPVPLECDDDDDCTADSCSDEGGCAHAPIPGCCHEDADCDDGDPCTRDECGADGYCVTDPGSRCGRDAGPPMTADAGPGTPRGGGCGCATGPVAGGEAGLVLLLAWVVRRRRG